MRTVFVSTGSHLWGTNYRVLGLARSARELGLDAHVILPGLAENVDWFPEGHYFGVPIHFTSREAFGELQDKYKILCSLRPEFVHCTGVIKPCFPPCVAYQQLKRAKLIVDIDEHLSRIEMFGAGRRLYFSASENFAKRFADRLIVASRFLETWFGTPRRKPILYLPNAVDLDLFRQQRTGWEELKRQWGQRKVVMYFGGLFPHYDADMVFDAAVTILARRRDLVFVFVGGGGILESLRAKTKKLSLEDAIRLCGFVPDEMVPKYLCAADAFVFPIRDNWWNRARCPGKVYHFTATEAPIVTNPVGEVREALGDRAWYFKDGDIDDLIKVLETCLDNNQANRRPDLSLAERHSWRARARTYIDFLEEEI
jgi:glycosyltransferase involved in cell wall biosynthesis